jgi:SPP1 family predicted phage head-tail adaptor
MSGTGLISSGIHASDFTRRVTMVSYDFAQGPTGGINKVLAESFDTWADVESKGGSQYVTQAQVKNDSQWTVTIRYRPQVTENWNVIYEGQVFIITKISVVEPYYKKFMILNCSGSNQQESWS